MKLDSITLKGRLRGRTIRVTVRERGILVVHTVTAEKDLFVTNVDPTQQGRQIGAACIQLYLDGKKDDTRGYIALLEMMS